MASTSVRLKIKIRACRLFHARVVFIAALAAARVAHSEEAQPLVIEFHGAADPPAAVKATGGGLFSFQFEIYDAPTGGKLLHHEEQRVVVTGSKYTALIGQTKLMPASLADKADNLWLDVSIDFENDGFDDSNRLKPRVYLAPFIKTPGAGAPQPVQAKTEAKDAKAAAKPATVEVVPHESSLTKPAEKTASATPTPKPEPTAKEKPGAHGSPGPAGPKGPKGDKGDPGPAGAVAAPMPPPGAPSDLRITPVGQRPPFYSVRWSSAAGTGVAGYAVYESGAPLKDDQRAIAERQFAPGMSLSITLASGGGPRWLRVAAVNFQGVEGALSTPIAVSPSPRISYAANSGDTDVVSLYVKSARGRAAKKVGTSLIVRRHSPLFCWSPSGIQIAFLTPNGAAKALMCAKANPPSDKPEEKKIADAADDYAWLPGGDQLAYIADGATSDSLVLISPDSGSRSAWVAGGNAISVAPSPRGDRIALIMDTTIGGPGALKTTGRLQGADRASLYTLASGTVSQFAWSPEGGALAFRVSAAKDEPPKLMVADADRGTTLGLASSRPLAQRVSAFAWSPEGRRLAYTAAPAKGDSDSVFVEDAASSGTALQVFAEENAGVTSIEWSPDGNRLAVIAAEGAEKGSALFVADAGGWFLRRVTPDVNRPLSVGRELAWSPDGRRLAYRADQQTRGVIELFVMTISGEEALKVSHPEEVRGDVGRFQWSPDGLRILYRANREGVGLHEIYVSDITGAAATLANDPMPLMGTVADFAWSPIGETVRLAGWSAPVETKPKAKE